MQAFGIHGSRDEGWIFEPAPDVVRVATGFANAYLIHGRDGWILVDTGVPGMTGLIRHAAARHCGSAPPVAIVQTHGHFDHTGGTQQLATEWGVPVYAHPLEFPYLRGESDYPPKDPTVGGAMGMMSRVFPDRRREPVTDLRPLDDGTVPGAPGWRWLHTPGHARDTCPSSGRKTGCSWRGTRWRR